MPPVSSFHAPSSMYGPFENTSRLLLSPLSWSSRNGANACSAATASGKSGNGLRNL